MHVRQRGQRPLAFRRFDLGRRGDGLDIDDDVREVVVFGAFLLRLGFEEVVAEEVLGADVAQRVAVGRALVLDVGGDILGALLPVLA